MLGEVDFKTVKNILQSAETGGTSGEFDGGILIETRKDGIVTHNIRVGGADKICVDEETVRLRSHIQTAKDTLTAGGSVGRKLDFIAQEMNREANTILSKSNDLKISDTGISLKTDIEKVREQIQNIE